MSRAEATHDSGLNHSPFLRAYFLAVVSKGHWRKHSLKMRATVILSLSVSLLALWPDMTTAEAGGAAARRHPLPLAAANRSAVSARSSKRNSTQVKRH